MNHFLIKNTAEYRFETIDDVKDFHKELLAQAETEGYFLTNFSWTEKFIKESKEIVGSYFQVKATFQFNELKEPNKSWCAVLFDKSKMLEEKLEKDADESDDDWE